MDILEVHEYCLSLPFATEDMPFGDDVVTLRVGGKIFAMLNLVDTTRVSLKCDPDYAEKLREHYEAIRPAWHMNKRHWNDVGLAAAVPSPLLRSLIRHSYNCVARGLPRAIRDTVPPLSESED